MASLFYIKGWCGSVGCFSSQAIFSFWTVEDAGPYEENNNFVGTGLPYGLVNRFRNFITSKRFQKPQNAK